MCNDREPGYRPWPVKSGFCRSLPAHEWRSERRIARRERGIWQRRHREHLIRGDDDLPHHTDYIHINPVKHGHVARTCDWLHSSFRPWAEGGVYPLDCASDEQVSRNA